MACRGLWWLPYSSHSIASVTNPALLSWDTECWNMFRGVKSGEKTPWRNRWDSRGMWLHGGKCIVQPLWLFGGRPHGTMAISSASSSRYFSHFGKNRAKSLLSPELPWRCSYRTHTDYYGGARAQSLESQRRFESPSHKSAI